jgi:hypothetical protein
LASRSSCSAARLSEASFFFFGQVGGRDAICITHSAYSRPRSSLLGPLGGLDWHFSFGDFDFGTVDQSPKSSAGGRPSLRYNCPSVVSMAASQTPVADGRCAPGRAAMAAPPSPPPLFRSHRSSPYATRYAAHRRCGGERSSLIEASHYPSCPQGTQLAERVDLLDGLVIYIKETLRVLCARQYHLFNHSTHSASSSPPRSLSSVSLCGVGSHETKYPLLTVLLNHCHDASRPVDPAPPAIPNLGTRLDGRCGTPQHLHAPPLVTTSYSQYASNTPIWNSTSSCSW